jgi:DNA-binding MarR family transcriptional regulator
MPSQPSRTIDAALAMERIPCMCAKLRGAARAVSRLYDDRISRSGVPGPQFTLLMILSNTGPIRQGEIAQIMLADATTLSRTLQPLEREGWIACEPGEDRRERLWSITTTGRRKLDAAQKRWSEAQASLRDGLTEAEWSTLHTLLAKVSRVALAQN